MTKLNKLEVFLIEHIKAHGSIPLGAFMTHALCHPSYGYYQERDPFGVDGDFITAPEVSQMFGEVIGAWVVDTWFQMGKPERFNLIECGPGRGTLMKDALRGVSKVHDFMDAVNINLVENSRTLRKKQEESLKEYNVKWWDDVAEIQGDIPVIIIGNEFLDALPVEHLMRTDCGWQQKDIRLKEGGGFSFGWSNASEDLMSLLPDKTISHEIYEVSPARYEFTTQCARSISANGGAALLVDYGYTSLCKGDTVQAIQDHEYASVLSHVGQCDITAHVDFCAVLSAAKSMNCCTFPVINQGQFLCDIGMQHRAENLKKCAEEACPADQKEKIVQDITTSFHRLTSSSEMGSLFKVCCFYQGFDFNAAGFCA
ncbi:MAG: class I SAM-dependent methyltransferase [Alphaproteobacteria bacterium]